MNAGPELLSAPLPPPPAPFLYELRPLSLGEILDRTFSIYRKRFWLYVGLSSIAAAVPTLSTFVQFGFAMPTAGAKPEQAVRQVGILFAILIGTGLVALIAFSLTQSATVAAVTATYLGETTSIGSALRIARKHWLRYILITLWQGWSATWVFLVAYILFIGLIIIPGMRAMIPVFTVLFVLMLLASFVYGVIAYLRNSLGVVASTVEDLKVRAAMRRSKVLVAGHKGRVFVIFLLAGVLQMVASVVQGFSGYFVGISHGFVRTGFEALSLAITFVTSAMVVPVSAIALCLFYVDERVRKEGFDVEMLMNRAIGPPVETLNPDLLPSPFTSELT